MPSLATCWCPFWLIRRCFLGRWICLLVSEWFRLVWWCCLFDYSKQLDIKLGPVYNQNPIDRWMKGCILPFPKKGDLGLVKNYRGITLTSIAAKIYNALLRNRIEPKIDNILRKNQNGFRKKNQQATLLFVDFTKAFDSIHRGKMGQILLAYGLPKETVAAITILYRNAKVKVRSPDGDTEFLTICLYWPSLLVGPLDGIQCLHRADGYKFLLVSQHWWVSMCRSPLENCNIITEGFFLYYHFSFYISCLSV